MAPPVPAVEFTHYTYPHGTRSPHRKQHTPHAPDLHRMCTHLFVDIVINACFKFLQFRVTVLGSKRIRILQLFLTAVIIGHQQAIISDTLSRHQYGKEAIFILHLHGIFFPRAGQLHCHSGRSRNKCLDQKPFFRHMRSQQLLRFCRLRINQLLNRRPIHQII